MGYIGEFIKNQDGYDDKNVTSGYKFELSLVFHDISILFVLYNMGKVSYNQIGKDLKQRERRFTVVCLCSCQNLKTGHFTLLF